jgi:hypothetical protein
MSTSGRPIKTGLNGLQVIFWLSPPFPGKNRGAVRGAFTTNTNR